MSQNYSTKCAKWSGFVRICFVKCKIWQEICILCDDDREIGGHNGICHLWDSVCGDFDNPLSWCENSH